jgi:peptide alpha-N-acetyltransferase
MFSSRYFLELSIEQSVNKALDESTTVGVIVCNLQDHRNCRARGYVGMLAVKQSHRGRGIAKKLITMAVEALKAKNADEIVLETEVSNSVAMRLYENMGFVRSKRLNRYYLNASDAFRLILPLTHLSTQMSQFLQNPEGEVV